MYDIMLDLETLSNSVPAIITQIGAAKFDRLTGGIQDTFFINVDADSCARLGMTMNVSTVFWWFQQSDTARKSLMNPTPVPVATALFQLSQWVSKNSPDNEKPKVWCHTSFDFPIINKAYELWGTAPPWSYRHGRDLRTIVDLSGINLEDFKMEDDLAHNALNDCLYQIKYAVAAIKRISNK